MGDVFVVTEHLQGELTDASFEAVGTARSLASDTGGQVVVAVVGSGVADMASQLGGADRILVVDDPALEVFNPDGHARVFTALAEGHDIVVVPYTSVGMDVASDMAVRSGRPLVSFCTAVSAGGRLGATCQLYAGKIEADVVVDGTQAIFAVLSGSGDAAAGRSGGAGNVEVVENPADLSDLAVECLGVAEPEAGDVDITAQDVLVVVGRGIESEDNIEEAQELADALGGALAASRPIVDQGWLPKTRQVGKSGLTVKPRVYLTLGVSGAPEHVEGMKDAGTIIAVNTDPQAPIFGVADYGWVGDLFDLLPELIDLVESD
ncbi:MAG: electron transfer flavoprotein subunit alpha/FixB family protein [Acidimicrobiia bacterium]